MRYILHSDLNNFYASVECLYNVEIRNFPVVVVGDEDRRHGIVLSKNGIAKKLGVKTGEPVWEARQKCGEQLVTVGANFTLYQKVSKMVKDIYRRYTNLVESFGIDEAWIDISTKVKNFKEAEQLAHKIRLEVLQEIGVTVSIGVSFNKIFAKLGSDLKKPNAVTVISDENYKKVVWPLPVQDLIYVGKSTKKKLNRANINTIGDLAKADVGYLKNVLGKNGETLHCFANGTENSDVKKNYELEKSIGNSTTCPRDLKTIKEVETVAYILAENVASRMREKDLWCQEVSMYVKDEKLEYIERQIKLPHATNLVNEIMKWWLKLFRENYFWHANVRAVGVRVSKFSQKPMQYNFFVNENNIFKQETLEKTVENLRKRFGYNIIHRGNISADMDFISINPTTDQHLIHPISFFKF